MHVIPLGTGAAMPSKDSHFSATIVDMGSELILFDSGEGTQHRVLEAELRWSRLDVICITHLHGDHYFGLPGMLGTFSLLRRTRPLHLIAPAGLKGFLESLPSRNPDEPSTFPLHITELEPWPASEGTREVYASKAVRILACPIEHGMPAFGYRVVEPDTPGNLDADKARKLGINDFNDFRKLKAGEDILLEDGRTVKSEEVVSAGNRGKVFSYITDTRPCEGGRVLAKEADLVYHEATFLHEELPLAQKTMHSTAQEAAEIARDAGAKQLIIGHFSQRYENGEGHIAEAQKVFTNTDAAQELNRYELS